MADEKKELTGKSGNKKEKSKPAIFEKTAHTFREMKGEMKKVVWPAKQHIINNTGVVIVVVAVTGLIIGTVDLLLKSGVDLLLRMA